jgi:uncharacterized protein involved in exopolysaccharide biosynthesis
MQTILDRNGKFVATVDGPVNMEDLKKDGKTVVEGDAPLQEILAKMQMESRSSASRADNKEKALLARIEALEGKVG